MTRRKILFLATEDWFIRSHFLPVVNQAAADGLEVVIAARLSEPAEALQEHWPGARAVDFAFARGSLNALHLLASTRRLKALLAHEQPDFLYAIAMQPMLVATLARAGAPKARRIFALTGRGYMQGGGAPHARLALGAVRGHLRAALDAPDAWLLVENDDDRRWIEGGARLPDARVITMPGAGVDPERFAPALEPAAPPLRIGVAARLIHSKGVDLVVEALARLRAAGLDVRLDIAGDADSANPGAVREDVLAAWGRAPGVRLRGRVTDLAGFWAEMHVACLASRGGEGLPRTLIEAAACARPIVTTDVPGCRDFVRDGETGRVVACEDAAALAEALGALGRDGDLRARMGTAGRARVLAGYTTRHAAEAAARAWRA